jgi:hypothetical protein
MPVPTKKIQRYIFILDELILLKISSMSNKKISMYPGCRMGKNPLPLLLCASASLR